MMTDGCSEAKRISDESLEKLRLACDTCLLEKSCRGCNDWRQTKK